MSKFRARLGYQKIKIHGDALETTDKHLQQLTQYLRAHGVSFERTGFDNQVALEKHGIALARFDQDNQDCTHYLFLDSDMWFVERNTISFLCLNVNVSTDREYIRSMSHATLIP
jgi:hypothetical protein